MKLLVATGNPGKLVEVREILGGLELDLVSLADLGLEAPEEPFATFQENAAAKATACAPRASLWTLADDSGLCVDALHGAPGVRSARFAET
ncbi:MAG: non-canonical purine NTP pyrophosphatase, partial [Deltaproteobacteria bacterium]